MSDVPRRAGAVGGILLTGGASRRLGVDKASLRVAGEPLAERLAIELAASTRPVVEVGPGLSGQAFVREQPVGSGPLVAMCAGTVALRERGHDGAAIVLACDLPLMRASVLLTLANWPAPGSIVPVVDGRAQPLCARWSARDLECASRLVANGARSMQSLVETTSPTFVNATDDDGALAGSAFADVDTQADLERLGFTLD